jgi:Tol biopolymer transport system component
LIEEVSMTAMNRRRVIGAACAAALLCAVPGAGTAHAAKNRKNEELLKELKASGHRLIWASKKEKKEGVFDLYVSDADGSEHVNITNTPEKNEYLPRVNWKTGRVAFLTDGGVLTFMDTDGKNVEQTDVKKAVDKDWSPDWTKLAITASRKDFGFRIYDTKTKKTVTVARDKRGIIDIDWSADPSRMAFATRKELGFRYTVLTMKSDGTDIRPFCGPHKGKPYCHPCWHPSEMRLAWNSRQGLLVGDYDPNGKAGEPKDMKAVLTMKQVGWEDPCPRWSPDGRYMAWLTKGRRLHVVRVSDGAHTILNLPDGWRVERWQYDWVPKGVK